MPNFIMAPVIHNQPKRASYVLLWDESSCTSSSCDIFQNMFLTDFPSPSFFFFLIPGLWTFHSYGHSSVATCGQWNRPRLHFRHTETAANDHQRDRQGTDPDMLEFSWLPSSVGPNQRSAHECYGLWGNGPYVSGVWVGQQRRNKGIPNFYLILSVLGERKS